MQKHKKFGWATTNMFKVMFSKFGQNLSAAAALFGISLLLTLPYILSFTSLSFSFGYPFWQINTLKSVSLALSVLLMLGGSNIIVPALSAGYFAPKTADYLSGVSRDKAERRQIIKNSFGRVAGASACQALFLLIPIAAAFGAILPAFSGTSVDNAIYQYGKIGVLIAVYILAILVTVILSLMTMFSRQVAFFENVKGFRAVYRSFRLIISKNFWPTFGEWIVISMILSMGTYMFMLPIALIAIPAITMTAMLSTMSVAVMAIVYSLIGIVVLAIFVFVFALGMTGSEAAVCCLYFNARARTEDVAIPGSETE